MSEYLKTFMVVLLNFIVGAILLGSLVLLTAELLLRYPLVTGTIMGIGFLFWFVHTTTMFTLNDKKRK